jgi:hypothetical protein
MQFGVEVRKAIGEAGADAGAPERPHALVELREPAVVAAERLRQIDELVQCGQDEDLVTRPLGCRPTPSQR